MILIDCRVEMGGPGEMVVQDLPVPETLTELEPELGQNSERRLQSPSPRFNFARKRCGCSLPNADSLDMSTTLTDSKSKVLLIQVIYALTVSSIILTLLMHALHPFLHSNML
jgi:hypothetical protein